MRFIAMNELQSSLHALLNKAVQAGLLLESARDGFWITPSRTQRYTLSEEGYPEYPLKDGDAGTRNRVSDRFFTPHSVEQWKWWNDRYLEGRVRLSSDVPAPYCFIGQFWANGDWVIDPNSAVRQQPMLIEHFKQIAFASYMSKEWRFRDYSGAADPYYAAAGIDRPSSPILFYYWARRKWGCMLTFGYGEGSTPTEARKAAEVLEEAHFAV